ncbi:MAG: chorismate mutase, partial [Chloroflexi bacterium]|nr:chorismate mutase [Chloroflexota bacterium]
MRCRGIRGATTVDENSKEAIIQSTRELLEKMVEANQIDVDEIACAFFSTTTD